MLNKNNLKYMLKEEYHKHVCLLERYIFFYLDRIADGKEKKNYETLNRLRMELEEYERYRKTHDNFF